MQTSLIRACGLLALTLGLASLPARATTVTAPSFDSLVNQADYVVRAVVKSVNSDWQVDGANRSIVTKVELTVREVIKGNPPSPLVLEMLGGTMGDITMAVDGTPKFKVGDDGIFFIHGNGQQFSPLVGLMYGWYPVAYDYASGQDIVLRSNGTPLYDTKQVAESMAPRPAAAAGHPLTAAAFASQIRASAARQASPPSANAN